MSSGTTSYSLVTAGGSTSIVDGDPATDGDDGTDTLVGVETAEFKGGVQVGIAAPIILDLNGDGVSTIDQSASTVGIDWDGNGTPNRTGWAGLTDAFLVYDGNGTGSGAEELSFTSDKPGAKSDLGGLSAFDSNGDGQFLSADDKWSSFAVWTDRNSNGRVDAGEYQTLADAASPESRSQASRSVVFGTGATP
ncbi:MAG: hypothetical protein H0X36_04365 [Sphingomonadaceae bacterium]|nr:hypothetical protein [Sphingomonadaceae bacterium]